MSQALGWLVIVFCLFSLWGIGENILLIHKEKNLVHQSLVEIILKLIKDPIGLAFCFFAGISSYYPLAIALTLRGIMRSIHFIVYWRSLRLQREGERLETILEKIVKCIKITNEKKLVIF